MAFAFEKGETFRETSKSLYPTTDKNQKQMLDEWVKRFADMDWESSEEQKPADRISLKYEDLGEDVTEGSMLLNKQGVLCVAQRGKAVPIGVNENKVKGRTKAQCFEDYKSIKDTLSSVLEYQTTNNDDKGLAPLLKALNKAYDDFVKTYGHLNKNTSISFLKNDMDFSGIAALENVSEQGKKDGKREIIYSKTDIFTRRVVEKENEPNPTNVKDGIIASIYLNGHVDIPYIAEQLDKDEQYVREEIVNSGLGFENPISTDIEVSYEYLSGNVREKLAQARAANTSGQYDLNIKALERVAPMDIPAHLIEFTLGSSWVSPRLYTDFVKERTDLDVTLTNAGGTWIMKSPYYVGKEKNKALGIRSEICNRAVYGHELIEAALQNKSISVSKTVKHFDGTTETITDKGATIACANKIDEIRQDFKDWARQKMQSDPELSEEIERIYNERFNNYVPKSIGDEFVPEHFGGQARVVGGKEFKLRSHQAKAAIRATTQPLMLAHEVGTGKTYTLITIAMEMRRLGTARKPMIVVQNATVGQFVGSAKSLYPNARILTLEDADRNAEGRKNFYAKIRYNDWDMIVVPQSVFERIPDSPEREIQFVQDKIEEKMRVLEQLREISGDNSRDPIVRRAEKEIEDLNDELNKIMVSLSQRKDGTDKKEKDKKREAKTKQNAAVKAQEMLDRDTDDTVNFDDMGIDALLIDEAHEYKHLGFETAMQRGVKGVDPSYSKKSQGVYLKTQAVLENNNDRNVVFATGTPISNTAAEIWTFMRYLMPSDVMKEYSIFYFDDFVRNFGLIQNIPEFGASGKYKEVNRFLGYVNLPELVRIWSGVADTVLTKEAGGVADKIPETEDDELVRKEMTVEEAEKDRKNNGGRPKDIYLPQTKALRSIMLYVKSELNRFEQMSGKEKKENSHIPLVMYGIAKAAAVDARLVLDDAADEPNSKTNEAVRQTLRSLEDSKKYKGTVAIFADNYQNKRSGFNLYEDIHKKLIAKGVPEEQIVVMKPNMTVKKKLEIFDKVNRGEVRVIMGSTYTLGTGVNIQEQLYTLIHVDAPNRPMDYTQRNGRILRQGNLHKEWGIPVRILRFGVEDSLDVTAYQRLKTKGAIADSIMNGKRMMSDNMNNRVLEEEQDMFGDITAQLSGSQYALLKNQVEKQVKKLESRRSQWQQDQTYIHNQKPRLKGQIMASKERKALAEAALKKVESAKNKEILIGKARYKGVDDMADYIKDFNKKLHDLQEKIRTGFNNKATSDLTLHIGGFEFTLKSIISQETKRNGTSLSTVSSTRMTYDCDELGLKDIPVTGQKLKNALTDIVNNVMSGNDFREIMEAAERSIERNEKEIAQLESREGKPFEDEENLKKAYATLEEYEKLMKKELEEKEAKYAEMDKEVEVASDISLSEVENENAETEDNNRYRIGENNPEIESPILEEATNLCNKLGVKVKFVHDVEKLIDKDAAKQKRMRKSKGWLDTETGEVTIVLPNASSVEDVRETITHEVVAHHGLRKMFGKDFNTFLDNVYANAEESIQNNINARGDNKRIATEEYLAELAERGFEDENELSFLQKVKKLLIDMLRKAGINLGFKLSDNELRYILWKSYQNLNGDNVIDMAKDIAMQYELKVGEYRFRDAGSDNISDGSREEYEKSLLGSKYKLQEAYQDGMLALKKLQDAIAKVSGKPIEAFENAYMAENQMSSKSTAEAERYYNEYFEPLEKEIAKLIEGGATYEKIVDYIILKHGIERNIEFSVRDVIKDLEKNQGTDAAKQIRQHYDNDKAQLQKDLEDGVIKEEDYLPKLEKIGRKYVSNISDYSATRTLLGKLTGKELPDGMNENKRSETYMQFFEDEYGEDADVQALANTAIKEFESQFDVYALWKKIDAATHHPLRKSYESGLMSKENYKHTNSMFRFYVPLRGWDEKTAEDVYDYLSSERSPVNSVLKSAKGRKSIPNNPFPVIGNMAESTILQGNRNLMKQALMSMVMNHPTDVATFKKAWYVIDPSSGEWVLSYPSISEKDTAKDIETKIREHEGRMKELEQEGKAVRENKDLNIDYRIGNTQAKEHIVTVKRNGKDYLIFINGNPRAAQAVNGMTNPDVEKNPIMKAIGTANRWIAANFTTRNPAFVLSNLTRDLIFAQSAVLVKESPEYAGEFFVNVHKAIAAVMRNLKGKADMNKKTDRYFKEFIENGGETGYITLTDVDKYKKRIKNDLERLSGKEGSAKHALRWCVDRAEDFNRWAEDVSRFTTYLTSRKMGRSITEAVNDAKEITVNFNRKGAALKTGGMIGISAGILKGLYLFFNAGVQSLTNFGRLAKKNPAKFGAMLGGYMAAGFVVPVINQLLFSMFGDEGDDPYKDLPEWIRRNNLCLYVPIINKFVTIPFPIELRAFYGLGEMAYSYITTKGKIKPSEMAYDVANQITELLPLNPLGHNGDIVSTLMPDALKPFWQINQNKDFTGRPVFKETPFNELDPEFKRVYKGTSGWLIDSSQFLNDISGGSDFRKGMIDINPAKIEHLFESYFGGMGKTFNQIGKTLWYGSKSLAIDETDENFQLRNMPIVNRFMTETDERSAFTGVNKEYFRLVEEFESTEHEVNGLSQKAALMNPKYLKEYIELTNGKRFKRYQKFSELKNNIDELYKKGKAIPNSELKERINQQIIEMKRLAIAIMNENGNSTTEKQ